MQKEKVFVSIVYLRFGGINWRFAKISFLIIRRFDSIISSWLICGFSGTSWIISSYSSSGFLTYFLVILALCLAFSLFSKPSYLNVQAWVFLLDLTFLKYADIYLNSFYRLNWFFLNDFYFFSFQFYDFILRNEKIIFWIFIILFQSSIIL